MPAQVYVTGPVLHYIVFGNTNTAVYLGTSEVAPRVRIRRSYKPVMNDLAGALAPLDRIYQGQEAQIVTALSRYDETVYAAIAGAPSFTNRGTDSFFDLGSLVNQNGKGFQLILQFPFSNTVNQPATMPPYYRFLSCICEQDDFNQLGTIDRQTYLAVTAQRVFNPTGAGIGGVGGNTGSGGTGVTSGQAAPGFSTSNWITYTNTIAGINLPNPT